jgi:DNA polymerase V
VTPLPSPSAPIALVDCNSCYASAETIFRPWLRDRPVVVMSSNDGNVIARSAVAKALGIAMGAPWHEIAPLYRRGQIVVFSSNFALYQDISDRVMALLGRLAPAISVYSIDEAWVDLSGLGCDLETWGHETRTTLLQQIGMPVGVGISVNKTLAKLANWGAKTWAAQTGNVVDLRDAGRREKLLKLAPVSEVWGIGSRLTRRLEADLGISTAWQLATANPRLLRRHYGVTVERTARELAGERCFPFDEDPVPKQQIIASQSFGRRVHDREGLAAALASLTARAAAKLRGQGSLTHCLQAFVHTSPFDRRGTPYSARQIVAYPNPTDDSRELVAGAMQALERMYQPGPAYAKAGVMLSQFVPARHRTDDLFAPGQRPGSEALMLVMDRINAKMGRGTVRIAQEEVASGWQMRREFLSPAYTTRWEDLPEAW